ncbi:MAG: biotin synthase BioB [Muribaculaceae bacterium]|nr:biotin synthase BioB [Muribaculaceae bacterium]MDE5844935.1 biotin synthase BioB [Muribaculaceae bacterium]
MDLLEKIEKEAIEGKPCSIDDALDIAQKYSLDQICDAADHVRQARMGDEIDTCSIINARSGKCSEDCKWCAQSRFHSTGCEEYDIVDIEDLREMVTINTDKGVKRFSLVTSGRKIAPADIDRFCDLIREARKISPIKLCASMGLLGVNEMKKLKEAGVSRYHCNLETSSSFFPTLCSTHSTADKLATIKAAQEAGLEVCSGGIIGMGETLRQRLELAQEARDAGVVSIPVNILNPIPGTPLEKQELIAEKDVILTIALFRLIAPDCNIRFAGGRKRMSKDSTKRILKGGLNGSIVGDMLTTLGNDINQDRELFESNGFKW